MAVCDYSEHEGVSLESRKYGVTEIKRSYDKR